MYESMLTTIDNPFDPFDQYDEWYAWDTRAHYHTPSFLAHIANTSSELSEADRKFDIENAIDEIVRENVLGVYKKVTREIKN